MKNILLILLSFTYFFSFSQLREEKEGYYLEDQLYFKLSYNVLKDLPASIHQSGFSNNISFGFIRDIPMNKQRNFGIGIGVGYGSETYFHNIKITENNNQTLFENFEEDFDSNRLKLQQIEFPFEIRWRTSTIEKYKFWRIYSGVKINYILTSKSVFKQNGEHKFKNLHAINKLQYGISIAAGYGTFNFYFYYGLSPLFKDASFNDKPLNIKEMKFGLQFYIL